MQEIKAVIRESRLHDVLRTLHAIPELPGVTVSVVRGFGRTVGDSPGTFRFGETTMAKLEIVVASDMAARVVDAIAEVAHTGRAGDGKIFLSPVTDAVQIRTREHGLERG